MQECHPSLANSKSIWHQTRPRISLVTRKTCANRRERVVAGSPTQASSNELPYRFSEIAQEVAGLFGLPKSENRFQSIRWSGIPFAIDKPRFGVEEVVNSANLPALLLAEALRDAPRYLLDWVLWREAVLEVLCCAVRLVPEAADLGLYAGIKYGSTDVHHRERLYRIWESVSPPHGYEFYSYSPTAAFPSFDKVAEGRFLQMAIPWLNATFCGVPGSLSSSTFTSALERWMLEFNRLLTPRQLRILMALSDHPDISQTELAEHVGLSQASVSRILKRLADSHLVRLYGEINLPLIGLSRVGTTFSVPRLPILDALRKLLEKIRYALLLLDFDGALHCGFAVPFRRLGRFRRWLRELAVALNLPPPGVQIVQELICHRNFGIYDSEGGGWPLDYESILDNISRLIRGEWSDFLPPLRRFRYSESPISSPIRLQPQDFVYMQRAVGTFFLTDRVASTEAREARLAGFRESEHMSYRRRLQYLEQMKLLFPALGVAVFHIGLDATINVLLEGQYGDSIRVLSALQLLPHIDAAIYDDGSASAALLVPKPAAVAIKASLQDLLTDCGINSATAIKPTWQAYGRSLGSTVDSRNYDFEQGDWLWTKDTLPEPRPAAI